MFITIFKKNKKIDLFEWHIKWEKLSYLIWHIEDFCGSSI